MKYVQFSLLILVVLLSGCANYVSKEQCTQHDWYAQGVKEGRDGKPMRSTTSVSEHCAKQGIVAHTEDYQQGWDDGIGEYCSKEHAYQRGLTGQELVDYCPQHLKQSYAQAWHEGLEAYCSPNNGFNRGRSLSPYPAICNEYNMTRFATAYRAGLTTHQEMKQVKQQIRKAQRNQKALHLTSSKNLTPTEQAEITQLAQQLNALEEEYNALQHKTYQ